MKPWTTKEISYIKRYALLAETNQVLNIKEMAKKLDRSIKAVEMKIYKMQKAGQLPEVDLTKSFDPSGRKYSLEEDKRIIAMYKSGATYKAIGESVDRTEHAIAGRILKLKKLGKIKNNAKKAWTSSDEQLLLKAIKFDKNGYVSNYDELVRKTKLNEKKLMQKVSCLRKQGKITQQADRTKASVKSKEAMNKFNDARFAQYKKKEAPQMEKTSVASIPMSSIDVESKEVILILTTIVLDGHKIQQYFTKEGQLVAQKELTPVTAEVSQ